MVARLSKETIEAIEKAIPKETASVLLKVILDEAIYGEEYIVLKDFQYIITSILDRE